MKSIFRLLAIAFLCCSFVACEKENSGDNPKSDSGILPPAENPWDGVKRADLSYQLLIYSFADSNGDGIGDFRGIVDKLGYFDDLGVSALWLSPAHPAMSYHGYDVLDYTALNPAYGTEEDFKALIDAAHSHGIKIYMDWVINHTGKDHPWFKEALADPESEYRDYYILSTDPQADIAAGKIPMINTEGAAGYDAGQWFAAPVSGTTEAQKLKFTLKWSSTPTLTVEQVETVENSGTKASDRFLYYGDPGRAEAFYAQGDDVYTLSLEFVSPWGCLVRTKSNDDWSAGTKFGSAAPYTNMEWGTPFPLISNAGSGNPQDILLPGQEVLMYHSHFWTDWFADLDYKAASECETSPAFKTIAAAAKKWIDLGIDGLRLDGAKHIYHNAASDENHLFWGKLYDELDAYFRSTGRTDKFYMVGEVFDDYQAAGPYYKGLPAIFDFGFWYRLEYALNNTSGCYFAKDIRTQHDYYASFRSDYIAATKLTNHDESRARSALGGSLDRAKMAAAMLLTAEGAPYIYYGEELGYVGIKEGKGDEYVRNPMKWGDSYTTTFMKQLESGMDAVGDVQAQLADDQSILNVYRFFAQLRNAYPALAKGSMSVHPVLTENTNYKQIAAWYMTAGDQRLLVMHNLSSSLVNIPLGEEVDQIEQIVGFRGTATPAVVGNAKVFKLGALSSVVCLMK